MTSEKWTIKTLKYNKYSQIEIVDLSDEQLGRLPLYETALRTAVASHVPDPSFSRYFVKGSITNSNSIFSAGNIEYGHSQALHCEEVALAVFRSQMDRSKQCENDIPVISIIEDCAGIAANPCGNCRDLLLDCFGERLEIVAREATANRAIVVPFQMYTFTPLEEGAMNESFLEMSVDAFREIVSKTISEGRKLTNDAYSSPTIKPERRYYATIVSENTLIHGSRDIMVDYHPIYALRDAIRSSRRLNDISMRCVVIVAEDPDIQVPHVMYKDRQHLHEFNLQNELLHNQTFNPPVLLVGHKDGKPTHIRKTSVKEWLPYPFTATNFGEQFVTSLGEYFRSK